MVDVEAEAVGAGDPVVVAAAEEEVGGAVVPAASPAASPAATGPGETVAGDGNRNPSETRPRPSETPAEA